MEAQIEARDYLEETALQKAAGAGAGDVVMLLIDAGADVNSRSPDWTILMSAVLGGSFEVVNMLVHAGSDISDETPWGESALTLALRNAQKPIATLLADQGAVLPRTSIGRRASTIASRKGIRDLVRRLMGDYGAVAAKPLQRQGSQVVGGLAEIQEDDEPEDDAPSSVAGPDEFMSSQTEAEAFVEAFQDVPHKVGFLENFEPGRQVGKGHFADVLECYTACRASGPPSRFSQVEIGRKDVPSSRSFYAKSKFSGNSGTKRPTPQS
jgi:hypothetical protein